MLQLDVKDDPSDLLTSVCGASDVPDKSDNSDIISRLFEGQVVNLVRTVAFIFDAWQL